MKKKALIVLLALMMILSMFAACTPSAASTPSTESTASVESSAPSVESAASSAASSIASSVPSAESIVASSASATSVVSAASSTVSPVSSKTASATSSKTASTTKTKGTSKIGSNKDYPNLPKAITIVQEQFMGDSTENMEQKKLWMSTLSARYGVNVTEDCITKTEVGTVYSARLAAGELTGIVYNYGWSYMFAWYNEGAVYPLDEYLKNNATWNMLPKAMRELFKIGNQTWAVPSGYTAGMTGSTSMAMWTQSIRNDWLHKLGFKDVGYTLDVNSFKEIITAFGDRSSELGVSGVIPIIFGGDLYSVINIFAAFDAWVYDPNSSYGFTYNPTTNCFEDALLKDGARQALEYVRYFYTKGYTTKSTFDSGFSDMRNQLASAKIGSFCLYCGRYGSGGYTLNTIMQAKYGTTNPALIGDGYTEWIALQEETWVDTQLVGLKDKALWANSAASSQGGGGYCLMVGTPQPAETVNFFVDLMFSSEDSFIECYWNLMDTAIVRESDGTFTRKYFDAAKKISYSNANLACVVETELYPAKNLICFTEGSNKDTSLKRTKANIAYVSAMSQAAIAAGRVVILPEAYKAVQNYSSTYVKHSGEILSYQNSFIYDGFMKSGITVDKLFATYKKNMAAVGGDKILQEANTAFGWVNDYQSYT